jgi:enoyl-CoA hydratase/carnithine racemase
LHERIRAFGKWKISGNGSTTEPSLTVAIITGAGEKAFSAGADLKEWNDSMKDGVDPRQSDWEMRCL